MRNEGLRMKEKIAGLYAVIDSTYVPFPDMESTAREMLDSGVRLLQLRAKGAGSKETLEASKAIKRTALEFGAVFIVNDRADIAILAGADGVHLGQDDIPVRDARRLLGPESVIGVSTHDPVEAKKAEAEGADYISFGPVFPTSTKKDAQSPRGLERLGETRKATTLPIVAIGGITENNAQDVVEAGADAVAVISEILLSGDIPGKTVAIISRLRRPEDA